MPPITYIWKEHREKILYLIVGGWNTIFGFGLFWILHYYLGGTIHYLVLLAITNEVAILNAFLCYRWIVFRHRGSVLLALVRFHGVYIIAMAAGLALTASLVVFAGLNPVVANGFSIILIIICGYFSHRHFSFK